MTDTDDIASALQAALPPKFHPDIPVLARVLTAARDGQPASVATENLQAALHALQGKTLNVVSGNITVSNVSGKAIAIGHGAISIYIPDTAEQKQAWRKRSRMLEKVRTYWIEGFLQQSLHKIALIELGMQYYPDALEYPIDMYVQFPDRPRTPVPPGTSIAEVFDDFGSELLILGSPGTGKTTMLLELTRTLIERAQQDETHAIPVVFNLSSWATKRQPLADWMITELQQFYKIKRQAVKKWIDAGEMLPLLDGLDEVQAEYRIDCINKIHDFGEHYGMAGMVVCSRVADYEMLPQKLRLQGAVLLQTLSNEQIEDTLRQVGDKAKTVRKVLRQLQDNAQQYNDAAAQELMRTPLILNITALAYEGNRDSELLPPDAPPAEQQRHLFATYVDQMFKRRSKTEKYTPEQTKHWLSWLAERMVMHNQTVFLIEQMQESWCTLRVQRLLGLLIMLATLYTLAFIAFLTFGTFGLVTVGLFTFLAGATSIYTGISSGRDSGTTIRPVEEWHVSKPALLKCLKEILRVGGAVTLGVGLFASSVMFNVIETVSNFDPEVLTIIWVGATLFGIIVGLVLGLGRGLLEGWFVREAPAKNSPNEGIRRSAKFDFIHLLDKYRLVAYASSKLR
jgi:DNA polymerase III delta prime subunit